jgi:large subunit ribosomal protein L13
MCAKIASILRGKHHPQFSPHWNFGDHVVVINAEKVKLTGNKVNAKTYFHYTGYPGGGKETTFKRMLSEKPNDIVIHAVRGMLPKNRLGRQLLKNLKVYAGSEHPHQAQTPEPLEI